MKHKHATLIKAWADGAAIEYQCDLTGAWLCASTPSWDESTNYRISNFGGRIRLADGYWLNTEDQSAFVWWHCEEGPKNVPVHQHLENIKEFPHLYSKRYPTTNIIYTGEYSGPEIVV
jgi:hypothetical protein